MDELLWADIKPPLSSFHVVLHIHPIAVQRQTDADHSMPRGPAELHLLPSPDFMLDFSLPLFVEIQFG